MSAQKEVSGLSLGVGASPEGRTYGLSVSFFDPHCFYSTLLVRRSEIFTGSFTPMIFSRTGGGVGWGVEGGWRKKVEYY